MTARYKSRMFDTEDEARDVYEILEWAGVHARVVGPIRTEIIDRQGAVTDEITEWEVNIVLPAEQPHAARPVYTPDVEPHEDDYVRSTIWDELEESRD